MTKRIGLMGCGVVADYGHVPSIKYVPDIELAAIYDPDAEHLAKFAERHSIAPERAFSDEDAFFASGLDAVSLTSPAPVHIHNVRSAAKRKLPVLCEKPLAMSAEEGGAMIALMKEAGAPLYVAFCYRFSLAALEIKKLVDAGAIGEVSSLRLIYNWDCHGRYHRPDPENEPDTWVVDPRREGRMHEGGPMVDCGTHQIDLATWWLGSPVVKHHGHGAWVDDHYESPDHVWAHLDHANGAHTCVEMSFGYGHTTRDKFSEFVYELIGTDGMIRYDRNNSFFELRTGQETRRLEYHGEKNFAEMYRDFGTFLNTGDPGNLCAAENALEVTRIARAATDDAIAGKAGKVEKAEKAEKAETEEKAEKVGKEVTKRARKPVRSKR